MLGLHVSISGSLDRAFDRAEEVGADTFQIFTRNPNQWKFKPIPDETIAAFKERRKESGVKRIVDHMPYLPNLASPVASTKKISRYSLDEEVKRCDSLGIDYLVVHLGSHLGKGTAVGVANIAEACNEAIAGSNGRTTILLENMAGQKNSIGARFEELAGILGRTKDDSRFGICLDTCHMFAAGFDLRTAEAVAQSMGLFNEVVGLERLKVVHLNDSKGKLGDHLDRHEYVGEGKIGRTGMRAFLRYLNTPDLPLIMEVPWSDERDLAGDLTMVRALAR